MKEITNLKDEIAVYYDMLRDNQKKIVQKLEKHMPFYRFTFDKKTKSKVHPLPPVLSRLQLGLSKESSVLFLILPSPVPLACLLLVAQSHQDRINNSILNLCSQNNKLKELTVNLRSQK